LWINTNAERPTGPGITHFLNNTNVKVGRFLLDLNDKIGYCKYMFKDIVLFILRISLIVALWAFVWKFIEPKTQIMRVLRAALLVLGLLFILAILKITGP